MTEILFSQHHRMRIYGAEWNIFLSISIPSPEHFFLHCPTIIWRTLKKTMLMNSVSRVDVIRGSQIVFQFVMRHQQVSKWVPQALFFNNFVFCFKSWENWKYKLKKNSYSVHLKPICIAKFLFREKASWSLQCGLGI